MASRKVIFWTFSMFCLVIHNDGFLEKNFKCICFETLYPNIGVKFVGIGKVIGIVQEKINPIGIRIISQIVNDK